MPHSLESCPDHVIELVITSLELEDVRNVRLTSTTVSAKASRGRFQLMLRSTYVDLTPGELRACRDRLQMRSGVPPVEQLYITGLAPQDQLQEQREEETSLLQEVFNELSEGNSSDVRLSLTLRLLVIRVDGTRVAPAMEECFNMPQHVRHCSTKTWHVTLQALAASQLRIRKINGFNEADMQCCSLPDDQVYIANDGHEFRLVKPLKDLESLSLSICNKVPGDAELQSRRYNTRMGSKQDEHTKKAETPGLSGVSKLIHLSPNLTSIHLHYYEVYGGTPRSTEMFQHVVKLKQLPTLKDCTIRGLSVRAEDLLDFITRTSPSNLTLKTIRLSQGKFDSIVKYCTSNASNVKSLFLDTLYEEESPGIFPMVLFDTTLSYSGIINGNEKLRWKSSVNTGPILFSVAQPQYMGCPARVIYRKYQQLEYGGFNRGKW